MLTALLFAQMSSKGEFGSEVKALGKGFVSDNKSKRDDASLRSWRNCPALLLLHGFPQDWSEWHAIMPRLAESKKVVVDNETGFLVPLEQMTESPFEPLYPEKFARDLAKKINELMRNDKMRERFGKAGRRRAEEKFSWRAIGQQTARLYQELLAGR